MPTNLPPEYFEVEKRYKAAESTGEKIATLEELIGAIPKHKGTDKLRAKLRRQLSKMKSASKTRKGASKHQSAFRIIREGAGQVAVIGSTNVGKSTLVDALTNASPEVADTPYTTWKPTPGMRLVDKAQIQLIDTPPLDRDFVEPELFDLIRGSDLILLVLDVQTYPLEQLEHTITSLRDHRIAAQHLEDHYPKDDPMTFIPVIVLANKCDDAECDEVFELFCEMLKGEWSLIPISATTGRSFKQLKDAVYKQLGIMRIFSKMPGLEPDYDVPFVMKKGSTVDEFARNIHQDFYQQLKSARVWGSSAFDGQKVQRDYILHDGDVVELRI
jgi:ribosome-interacting GTPase 1